MAETLNALPATGQLATLARDRCELRTHASGVAEQTFYLAVITSDGKRRILVDDLGTIKAVRGGWEVTLTGRRPFTQPTRDVAFSHAHNLLVREVKS